MTADSYRLAGNVSQACSSPLRDVFGISFEERCLANGCPLQTRDLDALQARQQRGQIPLLFMAKDFRCRDGQGRDVVLGVVVDAEVERVARVINARAGVLPVNLGTKEKEITGLRFDDKRTLGGIRSLSGLAARGHHALFTPVDQVVGCADIVSVRRPGNNRAKDSSRRTAGRSGPQARTGAACRPQPQPNRARVGSPASPRPRT